MTDTTHETWVQNEFAGLELGDARLLKRLENVVMRAAERPAGQISAVFDSAADRQGAYGLLGSPAVSGDLLARATHRATAMRCNDDPYVFVPLDGSSLSLTDTRAAKNFGSIGSHHYGGRGLKVMTALAVRQDGTPLGICHQAFWSRPQSQADRPREGRKLEEKETRHWVEALAAVCSRFAEAGSQVIPWFQIDREGDSWPLLDAGLLPGRLLTVRARHDRRLIHAGSGADSGRSLWPFMQHQPAIGSYALDVAVQSKRRPRAANMVVRSSSVTLEVKDKRTSARHAVTLWAVLATEVGSNPDNEAPLEWLLLTTRPVHRLGDAVEVITGYAMRWRIEEFHRAWKSGVCDVEDTQLRSREAVTKWATILGVIAIRLLRLTYLARRQPSLPAIDEISASEIAAIQILRRHKPSTSKQVFTIGQAVQCIAELGGYTGKSSGGPPGVTVLARGLRRVIALAEGIGIILEPLPDGHPGRCD